MKLQPARDLVAARYAARMHHLAIHHHARCGHHAIGHDVLKLFDLLQLDLHAFFLGDILNQLHRGFAVGTTGAENFDALHNLLLGKITLPD